MKALLGRSEQVERLLKEKVEQHRDKKANNSNSSETKSNGNNSNNNRRLVNFAQSPRRPEDKLRSPSNPIFGDPAPGTCITLCDSYSQMYIRICIKMSPEINSCILRPRCPSLHRKSSDLKGPKTSAALESTMEVVSSSAARSASGSARWGSSGRQGTSKDRYFPRLEIRQSEKYTALLELFLFAALLKTIFSAAAETLPRRQRGRRRRRLYQPPAEKRGKKGG